MSEESLDPLTVVSRDTWGALPPKAAAPPLDTPLPQVIVHWATGTDPCETTEACTKIMQDIQKNHMEEKGLDDIAYNFVIGGDGKAYTGRGWEGAPSPLIYPHHVPTRRIDIAYIGREWGRGTIPWEMLQAALQLLSTGVETKLLDEEYDTAEHPVEIGNDEVSGEEA
ncbi:peptidoglycan-recognition protein LB-like [Macrosteles quadrilineatus]|uniref:peptidoglycan-recognition protein LB-like n=1 Tax=Macrosteles quadrilineatus TaxID=74068 RepID=UPI0023E0E188|nr:peptidoglycan-recognition protein LB-like [Macrosteles quadrilineatus]